MRFYHLSPSDLAAMSGRTLRALVLRKDQINARERLEFINDVGAAFSRDEGAGKDHITKLINLAFAGDDEVRAIALESMTRM